MTRKIITPQPPGLRVYLQQLGKHGTLMRSLVKRDLKVKYAQSFLGLGWALLQPIVGAVIFSILFGRFIQLDTGNIPYLLFAFSGLIGWYLFVLILNQAGNALIHSQEIIRKIYFPKLVLVFSKTMIPLLEFLISLILLFVLIAVVGQKISLTVLFIPLFIFMIVLNGLIAALWVMMLSVRYRDVHHLVPYITNFAIWLTPVFYPVTIIPAKYHTVLYLLNPVALAIESFRNALFGEALNWPLIGISLLLSGLIFCISILVFIRRESQIADYI